MDIINSMSVASTPAKPKVVISLDVEADGPSPAVNSCLQIGIAVVLLDADPRGQAGAAGLSTWVISKRSWCLKPQPGRKPDERTMAEFWSKNETQLAHIREHEQGVWFAVPSFAAWYANICQQYDVKHWVCSPAAYDWQWLNALYQQYAPHDATPLPYTARCISSMKHAARMLGLVLQDLKTDELPHTHDAADDALQQAYEYLRILRELERYGALIKPELDQAEKARALALETLELLKSTAVPSVSWQR